jgi:hypothetical protein
MYKDIELIWCEVLTPESSSICYKAGQQQQQQSCDTTHFTQLV